MSSNDVEKTADVTETDDRDDDTNRTGRIGESFVYENYPNLFNRHYLIMHCQRNGLYPELKKTEGADLEAWIYPKNWSEPSFKGLLDALETGMDYKIVRGPIEIKTSNFNQYLAFNNWKIDKECGALPFPIWNSNRGEPQRYRLGNLLRMFYPQKKERERHPIGYVAVFLDLNERPYAALVFDDFWKLKKRLIEIGKEQGLDLTLSGIRKIPCEKKLNGWESTDAWMKKMMKEHRNLVLMQEMWYVKMSAVIELAKVVLIGDPPERKDITGKYPCPKELQESRWEYLQSKSDSWIPQETDDETKEIIKVGDRVFDWMTGHIPLTVQESMGEEEIRKLLF